jgi:hypothetical protein
MTVPTFNFEVLGKPMRSATEVRAQFKSADDNTQKEIITDLFGTYDSNVHAIMKSKLSEDAAGVGAVAKRHQQNDPRYKTSMTVDVKPNTMRKNMQAFRLV